MPFQPGVYDPTRQGRGPAPGAPNAGRPPSALRAALQVVAEERVGVIAAMADGTRLHRRATRIETIGTTCCPHCQGEIPPVQVEVSEWESLSASTQLEALRLAVVTALGPSVREADVAVRLEAMLRAVAEAVVDPIQQRALVERLQEIWA